MEEEVDSGSLLRGNSMWCISLRTKHGLRAMIAAVARRSGVNDSLDGESRVRRGTRSRDLAWKDSGKRKTVCPRRREDKGNAGIGRHTWPGSKLVGRGRTVAAMVSWSGRRVGFRRAHWCDTLENLASPGGPRAIAGELGHIVAGFRAQVLFSNIQFLF
jgi:hypothetical protein